jgi:hypothetical protein
MFQQPSERIKMTRIRHYKQHLCHRICALVRTGGVLALLLCPLTMSQAQDSVAAPAEESDLQRSRDLINLVGELESRIENIQSESGTYDPELLQPLDALTQVYIQAQNYEAAALLLDHQLQIHRVNSGLYAAQQIPIVESMLQMRAQADDWSSVNDSLDYLFWLYQRDTTLDAETQLQGLQALGNWQLRALGSDVRERQAYHLVQLAKLEQRTAEIAQRHFGDDNPALGPYLYNQALADTYIALAITLTSETSQDLMLLTEGIRDRPSILGNYNVLRTEADIEAVYGSRASTVTERSFRNNMSDSIEKIERITELYVQSGNIEAEAMALMYLGDANLMRQQFENRPSNFAGVRRGSSNVGTAISHYREALARFTEAGIGAEALAAFTRCPVMLPIQSLHATVQAATPLCEQSSESEPISIGEYNLVSTLIPGLEGDASASDEVITARVKFAVRTNGQVSNDNVEEIEPDDVTSRVQIRKLLDIMQFRPAIVDNEAVRSEELQLVIRIPKAN